MVGPYWLILNWPLFDVPMSIGIELEHVVEHF